MPPAPRAETISYGPRRAPGSRNILTDARILTPLARTGVVPFVQHAQINGYTAGATAIRRKHALYAQRGRHTRKMIAIRPNAMSLRAASRQYGQISGSMSGAMAVRGNDRQVRARTSSYGERDLGHGQKNP